MPALHIESEEKFRYRIPLGYGFIQMTASGRFLPSRQQSADSVENSSLGFHGRKTTA
jgi:hypothetical protein